MAWTDWRKIAEGAFWFDDAFDHDGAACYELALAGPRGGSLMPMYVGETCNETRRIRDYACNGSHLTVEIISHLRRGWSLWYRAWAHDTKQSAKGMQDRLLLEYRYPWNVIGQ